jgi:cytochrome c
MKKFAVLIAAALAPLVLTNVAHADLALATAKGCTACHQVDKKVLGPAYNAVAACYANSDEKKVAASKLLVAKHIKEGGAGAWGFIPMPAHPSVTDAEISKLVDWIMATKDGTCPKEFKGKAG